MPVLDVKINTTGVTEGVKVIKRGLAEISAESKAADQSMQNITSSLKNLTAETSLAGKQLLAFKSVDAFSTLEKARNSISSIAELQAAIKSLSGGYDEAKKALKAFVEENGQTGQYKLKVWQKAFKDMDSELNKTSKDLTRFGTYATNAMNTGTTAVKRFESAATKAYTGVLKPLKRLIVTYLSFRGIQSLFSNMFTKTEEQESALKQMEVRLTATGYAAGLTSANVTNMAESLSEVSVQSSTTITKMSALLLSFKNIKGGNFGEAMQNILDLSAATGRSMQTITLAIGRALNAPTKGLMLLKRQGVDFSASQIELIKNMVKVGDIAGAQQIILKELESRYKGSAKGASETLGGALKVLKNIWDDLFRLKDIDKFSDLSLSINKLNAALRSDDVLAFRDQLANLAADGVNAVITGLKFLATHLSVITSAITSLIALKFGFWFTGLISLAIGAAQALAGVTVALEGTKVAALAVAAANPFTWVVAALSFTVFATMNAKLKETEVRANITSTAIKGVFDKYGDSESEDLKQQLEKVRHELLDIAVAANKAAQEILSLSTIDFTSKNGILGGQVGSATEAFSSTILKNGLSELEKKKVELEGQEKALVTLYKQRKEQELAKGSGIEDLSEKSTSSGKSAAAIMVERMKDLMKYMNVDGMTFLGTLDKWISKMNPLTADWKLIRDLQNDIWNINAGKGISNGEYVIDKIKRETEAEKELIAMYKRADEEDSANYAWANTQGFVPDDQYIDRLKTQFDNLKASLSTTGLDMSDWFAWPQELKDKWTEFSEATLNQVTPALESLKAQFENGTISKGDYAVALQDILDKYEQFPLIGKAVEEALKGLNATTQTLTQSLQAAITDIDLEMEGLLSEGVLGVADALASAAVYSDDFGEALQKLGQDIMFVVAKAIILKGVMAVLNAFGFANGGVASGSSFSSALANSSTYLGNLEGSKNGNVFGPNGIQAFAKGGSIVTRPTIFPFAGGTGLMSEAGTEVIMPLERDNQGKLGVRNNDRNASVGSTIVLNSTVNVTDNGAGKENAEETGRIAGKALEGKILEVMYNAMRPKGVFSTRFGGAR